MLLKDTQTIGHIYTRPCEKFLSQGGADPNTGDSLVKGQLPIEGAGATGYAAANFIGVENGARCSEIADCSTFSCKPNLVGVADGSWVVLRLASQKQHDAIIHVDTGIVIDTVHRIDDAVADEDNWGLDIG